MKQLILGDIHGRTIWKDIIDKEKPDRVIFIGDYVDSKEGISGVRQLENLREIVQLKKQDPLNTVLLIGNHDYQYWPGSTERNSAHQWQMHESFRLVFEENKKLFQMCFVDEYDTWYSHAGFTKTWIQQSISSLDHDLINLTFMQSPEKFKYSPMDWTSNGDSIYQSCIWVRPPSLESDHIDKLQVAGHTVVQEISLRSESMFYLIDCLHQRKYLIRNNEEFQISQLRT